MSPPMAALNAGDVAAAGQVREQVRMGATCQDCSDRRLAAADGLGDLADAAAGGEDPLHLGGLKAAGPIAP